MRGFAAKFRATRGPIRASLRVARVIVFALPVAACASTGPDLLSLDAGAGSPALLALAPSGGEAVGAAEIPSPEGEFEQLALAAPLPASGTAIAATPSLQGQPLTEEPASPELRPGYSVYVDDGDPFEGVNRAIFHFNQSVDTWVLEPVAKTYRHIVPPPVRTSIRNAVANLESPVTLANDILQGEWERAHVTLARLVINSTFGIAGLHDRASEMGYEAHREDFDQTLALHGIPSGPYLVVPLLGPATPRHIVGRVVDSLAHPLTWVLAAEPIETVVVERAAEGVVQREAVLDLIEQTKATSSDYYGAVRSFYRQNRISEITNGRLVEESGAAIDLSEDLELDF